MQILFYIQSTAIGGVFYNKENYYIDSNLSFLSLWVWVVFIILANSLVKCPVVPRLGR